MTALSTFEQVELQEKLNQSSKEIERLNALVAMLVDKASAALNADASLPDAISVNYSVQKLERLLERQREAINDLRIAVQDTQATAEAYDREHAAKVLDIAMEQCDLVRNKYAEDVDRPEREFALLAAATNDCKNAIAELRATKVKEYEDERR